MKPGDRVIYTGALGAQRSSMHLIGRLGYVMKVNRHDVSVLWDGATGPGIHWPENVELAKSHYLLKFKRLYENSLHTNTDTCND